MTNRFIALALLIVAAAACAPVHRPTATMVPVFGPAVGRDVISGRADDQSDGVWLMVGGTSLVRIDLQARERRAVPVRVDASDPCWGLARLADGSMWTLSGRNALTQISEDGRLVGETQGVNAVLGLFSFGDRLLLQEANVPQGTAAMSASRPDGRGTQPWGAMLVRPFAGLAPGAAAAMNLVSCGTTESRELPCWFPDEPFVSLIAADGHSRRLRLEGFPQVSPDVLLRSSAPPRPIRDVFVERDGTIWVLGSGLPADGTSEPGGWVLARYSKHGQAIDRRVLPEPVRVLLRARSGRALVLTGSGMVAEVLP